MSSCKKITCRADQRAAELNAKQKRKNDFNSTYGQLGVTNDAEIDAKLNELEYKQQHESLSIQEEKLIIKQIKQLQASMATCMHPLSPKLSEFKSLRSIAKLLTFTTLFTRDVPIHTDTHN